MPVVLLLWALMGVPLEAQRAFFSPALTVTLPFQSGGAFNPADSTTYFFGELIGVPGTVSGVRTISVPGGLSRIVEVSGAAFHANAGATSEAVTVRLRKNADTGTDTTVGTYVHNDSAITTGVYRNPFRFANLSFPVAAGDFVEVVTVTPAWATNPTTVIYYGKLLGAP